MMRRSFKPRPFQIAAILGLMLLLGEIACTTLQEVSVVVDPPRNRSIGLIMHRGRFYGIKDLMNPAYRAASDDPFVKAFAPDESFAIPWAGLGPTNSEARQFQSATDVYKSRKRLPVIPWAGMYPGFEADWEVPE